MFLSKVCAAATLMASSPLLIFVKPTPDAFGIGRHMQQKLIHRSTNYKQAIHLHILKDKVQLW